MTAALFALAALAATSPAEPVKLMVMDVDANGVAEAQAQAITELVAVELSAYRPLDVASGADVRKLLELEAAQQMASCDDETSCLVALAGALGAELIVHGKASQLGSATLVTLHLFDVGEGRALARTSFQLQRPEALPDLVRRAIARLADEALGARGIRRAGGAEVSPGSSSSSSGPKATSKERVTLAELEALTARGAWQELLARALDVAPAERGEAWEGLVAKGAAAAVEAARAEDPWDAFLLDEKLSELFPRATGRPSYAAVRARVALEGLSACFGRAGAMRRRLVGERAEIPDCARLAEAYAERAAPSSAEALQLARLVRRNRHPSAAVGLFARAVTEEGADACADHDLELAVVSALYEPPESAGARFGRELAFERCFEELKRPVQKELARAATGRFFLNACPDLLRRGQLGRLQTRRCKRRLAESR